MPRVLRYALPIVALALVTAAFWAWKHEELAVRRGQPGDFGRRFAESAASMLIWALFTPPLLYAGTALPIRRPHRARNALLVGGIAAAVALLRAIIDVHLGLTTHTSTSVATLFHTQLVFALILIGIANFIRLEQEEKARRDCEARSETEAAEAVLRQLRADLNPHFLFNTLNAVAMLLHKDAAAAEEMLDKLRDFLRKAVATEHAREVRLADELEFVSQYFDIQKMRFAERLTTMIHVAAPHLYGAAVPPLLLQPLIENSIVHGIAKRRDGGSVAVMVDEEREAAGAFLRIQVRDNGPGCAPAAVFASGRVGVANAVARLESLYGTRQSLTYGRHGDDFVAQVRVPLRIVK